MAATDTSAATGSGIGKRGFWIAPLLMAFTFAMYLSVRHNGFLTYDDADYVYQNRHVRDGFSVRGITWAFTTGDAANYHPVTWISHQLDCQLFGLNAGRHHLVNVLIHTLNTGLLLVLIFRLTGRFWSSAIVAAFFGGHPMHVESVAWVAERKDTLSAFFWMLTVLAYIAYSKRPGIWRYGSVMGLFILALLCKPMVVTLPFVLLLLDYWPLGRMNIGEGGAGVVPAKKNFYHLFIEKVPLMVLSAVDCLVTFKVQKTGGAMEMFHPGWSLRLANATISYSRYVAKLIWPQNLGILYAFDMSPAKGLWVAAATVLVSISVFAVVNLRSRPYLFVGWTVFLGMLVPVIGVVQVGLQSMADRYSYLPSIGLFVALVWFVAGCVDENPRWKVPAIGLTVALLLGCLYSTSRQVSWWSSEEKLFQHSLEVAGDSQYTEGYLASLYLEAGNAAKAVEHFEKAVALNPNDYLTHNNLGGCLSRLGRNGEAVEHLKKSLELNPSQFLTHLNYAVCLANLGRKEEALPHFKEAIRLNPDSARSHASLANFCAESGDKLKAAEEFQTALRLDDESAQVHQSFGEFLASNGRKKESIREFEKAIELEPENVSHMNNLAWMLSSDWDSSIRNGARAVELALKACELTQHREPLLLGTLGNCYAEAGRFDEAVAAANEAIAKARTANLDGVAKKNQELLQLYLAHKAYHATP